MTAGRMVRSVGLVMAVVLAGAGGCVTSTVDRGDAQAETGAPQVAEVPITRIPRDANFPTYVVAVLPMEYGASGVISGSGPARAGAPATGLMGIFNPGAGAAREESAAPEQIHGPGQQIGKGMADQLITALANCGNIQVIEYEALKKGEDGNYSCSLQEGEYGPFIIKGSVTEFNETADLSEDRKGGSLGGVGAALGLLGGVTGRRGLATTGAGVAIANPTMEKGAVKRKGMVGLDLRIIDGRNSRIVGACAPKGTFTSISATSGVSLFGIGKSDAEFAASAIGQATRAAMNQAVQEITDSLKQKVVVK